MSPRKADSTPPEPVPGKPAGYETWTGRRKEAYDSFSMWKDHCENCKIWFEATYVAPFQDTSVPYPKEVKLCKDCYALVRKTGRYVRKERI